MSGTTKLHWSLNWRLTAAALLFGGLAVFGDPSGGGTVRIEPREMARIVEAEVDHVTVEELAGWLIEGRGDVRLLDLRSGDDYARYHIPSAENVPITGLEDYPLARNETIVLYSAGGIHAAQAWFLLEARGFFGAKILFGGLDAWMDEVLFPALPEETATAEQRAAADRARAVSAHFGGQPRSGAEAAAAPAIDLPQVAAPPPVVAQPRKKKSKGGC